MSNSNEWIARCLETTMAKANQANRAVPDTVIEAFRSLLAARFQQSLKNDEMKEAVAELATANNKTDASREG